MTAVPNDPPENAIGDCRGTCFADIAFFRTGFAAHMIPFLLMLFGVSLVTRYLSHLRHKWKGWAAALVYMFGITGLLGLFTDNELIKNVIEAKGLASLGGYLGWGVNYIFGAFGDIGSGILYTALILSSLYFLTNLQPVEIWHWTVDAWENWRDRREQTGLAAGEPYQKSIKRKTKRLERDLQKQKKAIEQKIEQTTVELKSRPGTRRRSQTGAQADCSRPERTGHGTTEQDHRGRTGSGRTPDGSCDHRRGGQGFLR